MDRNPTATSRTQIFLLFFLLTLLSVASSAQTRIKPPRNFFDVKDDVSAGREAAREVERELKFLRDKEVSGYVSQIGRRLVAALPEEYRREQFNYSFKIVDDADQNAFALPGGSIYINRGIIELARNEGELAGVIAHEISHIALRHGTAQASRAVIAELGFAVLAELLCEGKKAQVGQVGAYVGSTLLLLKFGRDYETQADVLGAQIMACAGYDPEDMSRLFRRLGGEGGGVLPRWLSSHPKLRDRAERVRREAALLDFEPLLLPEVSDFSRVRNRLSSLAGARARKSRAADSFSVRSAQ